MTNMNRTILSNHYLIQRTVKSICRTGKRITMSVCLIVSLILEVFFVREYLQRFISTMEQEIMSSDLKSAQINLDGNQILIMQFSLVRDILSFLVIIMGAYLLFDFRNKFSLIKISNKEDVETKIYLGVSPKYVLRELLLKNLFSYMFGLFFSYVVCVCINMKLLSSLNSILPYIVGVRGRTSIFFSMLLLIFFLLILLIIVSVLIEFSSMHKFRRTFSFY